MAASAMLQGVGAGRSWTLSNSRTRHAPSCSTATTCSRYGSTSSHFVRMNVGSSSITGTQIISPARQPRQTACRATTEANLFSRITRVFRSYANAIVSSAEDPEKMLDQTVNEMQGDLIKMRQASAQVVASQKQLEAKYKQAKQTSDDWYRRAELALAKGEEDLAREALKRRKVYEENAVSMKAQLDQQRKATDTLIANTRMLEQKLAEAKSKKDTLKARAKSAAASKQISEMVQGLSTSTAMAAFDKMEEKVMALEAESEATLQLSAPDELNRQFEQLEGDSVDSELAQLKSQVLAGKGPKAQLPEGRPIRDAIDWELEELRRKARE